MDKEVRKKLNEVLLSDIETIAEMEVGSEERNYAILQFKNLAEVDQKDTSDLEERKLELEETKVNFILVNGNADRDLEREKFEATQRIEHEKLEANKAIETNKLESTQRIESDKREHERCMEESRQQHTEKIEKTRIEHEKSEGSLNRRTEYVKTAADDGIKLAGFAVGFVATMVAIMADNKGLFVSKLGLELAKRIIRP